MRCSVNVWLSQLLLLSGADGMCDCRWRKRRWNARGFITRWDDATLSWATTTAPASSANALTRKRRRRATKSGFLAPAFSSHRPSVSDWMSPTPGYVCTGDGSGYVHAPADTFSCLLLSYFDWKYSANRVWKQWSKSLTLWHRLHYVGLFIQQVVQLALLAVFVYSFCGFCRRVVADLLHSLLSAGESVIKWYYRFFIYIRKVEECMTAIELLWF